jgi:flagellum-specific ATP synthase
VFALLPKLLERSGTSPAGSITGLYTVLVDGDDMNEPVADAVRAILDGHVVLSRDLAHAGHYPAIDVLGSVSRLVDQVVPADIRMAGQELRKLMAALREKQDLISIGAYQPGTDPTVDAALSKRDQIAAFLQQPVEHCSTGEEADAALLDLVMGGDPEEMLAADVVADEDHLPSVAPGASAIPPLHLAV